MNAPEQPAVPAQPTAQGTATPTSSKPAARPGVPDGVMRTGLLSPKQAAEVLNQFRAHCLSPGNQVETLEAESKSLREAGYIQELTEVLYDAIAEKEANPYVGTLWMRRLVTSKSWDRTYPPELNALCARGEIGHNAILELLKYAAQRKKPQLVNAVYRKHSHWLLKHPEGSRLLGRALINTGRYRAALGWLRRLSNDPTADPEIAFCTAAALRGLGKEAAAHRVVTQALSNAQNSPDRPFLTLWFCMEEALGGNVDRAAEAFATIDLAGWDEDALCAYYLTRGVIRVRRAPPERKRDSFKAALSRNKDMFRKVPVHRRNLLLRRAYRRCVWRMALEARKSFQGCRAPWDSADSWLTVVPLLLLPGFQLLLPVYLYRRGTRRKNFSR